MKNTSNFLYAILAIGLFCLFLLGAVRSNDSQSENVNSETEKESITQRQAISEHWDEIKEYVNGTGVVEACYDYGDRCYSLNVDLESGEIKYLYFPNGGDLEFDGVELDSEGTGEATSLDDREWSFDLDMDNDAVYQGISDWAENNNYEISYDQPDPKNVAALEEKMNDENRRNGHSLQWFGIQGDIDDLYPGQIDIEK